MECKFCNNKDKLDQSMICENCGADNMHINHSDKKDLNKRIESAVY